ncbi:hypothetical protein FISHEDRAFT_21212, partial [Fistulina hepatica ATCC 64428]
ISYTLISVSCLEKAGFSFHFSDKSCTICAPRPTRNIIAEIPRRRGSMSDNTVSRELNKMMLFTRSIRTRTVDINELHRIMAHCNHCDLKNSICTGSIVGVELDPTVEPEEC